MPLSALESMEADVVRALDHINVPSYVLDREGIVRYSEMNGPGEARDQDAWRKVLDDLG